MTEKTAPTCSYVAEKSDPESWHGDDPEDWQLDSETWSCHHTVRNNLIDEEATEQYCVFHTPPEEVPDEIDVGNAFVDAINEESASDDEDTARRKKQFVGAIFGSFTIEKETILDADDEYPIRFDHSVFQKGVSFTKVIFNHGIRAWSAKFSGDDDVSFREAEFSGDGDVSFWEAEFSGDGNVLFSGAEFSGDGDVSFREAEFSGDGDVVLSGAEFSGEGDVSFTEAKFSGDGVSFHGAEFSGDNVSFTEAEFSGDNVSFWEAEFSGDDGVSFREAEFSGDHALFNGAVFSGDCDVSFGDAKFSGDGDVSFREAEFSGDGDVLFSGKFSGDCDVSFGRAKFSGDGDVSFREAEFSGDGDVLFNDADFHRLVNLQVEYFASPSDVSFANADFSDCDVKVDSMAEMHLEEVDFTGVNLSGVDFSDAHLDLAVFSRTVLYGAKFHGAELDGASFGNAQVNESTEFVGDGLDSGEPESIFYDPRYQEDGETRLDWLKRAATRYLPLRPSWSHDPRSSSSVGDGDEKEDWEIEYLQKAARTYHTLEKVGRENSLPDLQTTGFVGRQEMHRYRYAEKAGTSTKGALGYWGKWIRASIARLTLLYGESPWRVIGVAMLVILASALLYPLGGFQASPNGPVFDAETIPAYISMLPDSLYFSTLTFTTLGFGDFQPHAWGRWLATTETALGATLMALLVFVLGRRAAR